MSYLTSDYPLVLLLEQASYLWDRAFCPFFMVLDFFPLRSYLGELRSHALDIVGSTHRGRAVLDLLAAIMRAPRAIFYSIFINIAFFHVVYKVGKWALSACHWLFRILRYLLTDAVGDIVRLAVYLAGSL